MSVVMFSFGLTDFTDREPLDSRARGSIAEEVDQRLVRFLWKRPTDVVRSALDFDEGQVRDELFVSQPRGGGFERQDSVGRAVHHERWHIDLRQIAAEV